MHASGRTHGKLAVPGTALKTSIPHAFISLSGLILHSIKMKPLAIALLVAMAALAVAEKGEKAGGGPRLWRPSEGPFAARPRIGQGDKAPIGLLRPLWTPEQLLSRACSVILCCSA